MIKKKGVSPVIATVILIAMVIVIALIIFLWFRGMTQEAVTKFGQNIELTCNEVQFDASYSGNTLSVSNRGSVPIYSFRMRIYTDSGYETKNLHDYEEWPEKGLNQGGIQLLSIADVGDAEKITLIPVLVGESEKGQRTFECKENHGLDITAGI